MVLVAGHVRPADGVFAMTDQDVVLLADFRVDHAEDGDLSEKIDLHLLGGPGLVHRIAHHLPV